MAVQVDLVHGATRSLGAKGIFAAALGNGLEFFDFTVYVTYLGMIGQAFFPSDNAFASDLASAATFGVGFIARPLGGAVIGAYGDRAGRRPAMTLSIGLMAIGSGIIAATPGYAAIGVWAPILLILARLLQGFAVGGEVGPATMFLLEAAPANRRMFFGSWQFASQNLGALASGLIGLLLALALSKSSFNDWGWRVPFAIGVLIAPVGAYIRSRLNETLDSSARQELRTTKAILSEVVRSNWLRVLLSLAIICGGTITQYFLLTLTPYAIRTLHLPDSTAMLGAVTLGITGCIGALAGGLLADRWGIRTIAIAPRIRIDAGPFSGNEVAHRQSKRSDARSCDFDPELAASHERRRRRDGDPADLSTRGARDRACLDLFARRGRLRRNGDLCRHLAGRRHGRSARLDLLRHGGECRAAGGFSGRSQC